MSLADIKNWTRQNMSMKVTDWKIKPNYYNHNVFIYKQLCNFQSTGIKNKYNAVNNSHTQKMRFLTRISTLGIREEQEGRRFYCLRL